jgi:uncharacterized protein
MGRYVLGLLRRGPEPSPRSAEEEDRLQAAHLAHLRGLRERGELIVYGPLDGDSDLRGILVFRTDSMDRARELMHDDPWIVRRTLVLELFSWFAAAGLEIASPPRTPTDLDFQTD